MASGLTNKLTGQIGEQLACAELGRRGLIATGFTGNVPEYDLLVCDDSLRTLPIQVKTSRGDNWPTRANLWMDIEIDDESKQQVYGGPATIQNPDLIYICIALATEKENDRFFICTKSDIQKACINSYKKWMDPRDWKRPKNYKSLDNRYYISNISHHEDDWGLVLKQLEKQNANNTQ